LILEAKEAAILSETFCKTVFTSGINFLEDTESESPFNKVNRGDSSAVPKGVAPN